jgi:hypothetical protein
LFLLVSNPNLSAENQPETLAIIASSAPHRVRVRIFLYTKSLIPLLVLGFQEAQQIQI